MNAKNLLTNNELLLYGDVGDPWGYGDGFTPSDVALSLAEHGAGDIVVRVNSGGGSAFDGMAIHSLLKNHAGKVTIAVDGVAASAASLIAMAGDRIEVRKGAMLMIHDPSGITWGTEDDHRAAADMLGKVAANYASVYADRSKKTVDEARAVMRAETWLSADDAVKEGFADAAIEDPAKPAAAFDYFQVYAHAPQGLPVRPRKAVGGGARSAREDVSASTTKTTAATAAQHEGKSMNKPWAAAFYAAALTIASGLELKVINDIVAKADSEDAANTLRDQAVTDARAAAERRAAGDTGKPWAATFYASASSSGVELKALNEIVAGASSLEQAKDKLIEAMGAARDGNKPGGDAGHNRVGADGRDKLVAGATKALIAKAPMFRGKDGKPDPAGEHNEFTGMTLRELARASLERAGERNIPHDPMKMLARAMTPVIMAGALSTSDFVNILANVANKAMLKGYEESPERFGEFTGKGNLPDFKTANRVDMGLFPTLTKVEEGAEYKYATLSDRGVTIMLATYGKLFPITRQAIINDDLGAFTRIPSKMGNAAKRAIADLVWAILTSNPTYTPDGVALFHANHSNLFSGGGTAMAAAALDTARANMAKQKDPDSIKTGLNIRPAFLLTPVALQGTANQLMASQSEPGQNNAAVANRVANMSTVISDARLDAVSTTAYYLAADPNAYDTIEVDYLNGVEAPTLEQREGWNVDGVEFKVRMDAGVNLLDFRGLQKQAGA